MHADQIDRLARRRAAAKMGLYIHASVFVLVNLLLAVLSASSGRHWAIFPALGWGIGLAVHAAVVLLSTSGGFEQLVQRERERLATQRDAW
jgi:hypothetical protein